VAVHLNRNRRLRWLAACCSFALVAASCGSSGGADDNDAEREVQLETRTSRRPNVPTTMSQNADSGAVAVTSTAPPTSEDESEATTTAPTTLAPAPTTVPPTTVPATTVPPTCSQVRGIPVGAIDLATIAGDVDGDGMVDEISTYGEPDRSVWWIRTELGRGEVIESAIADALLFDLGFPLVRPVGAVDLDGDGTAEVFVVLSAGAATEDVGLIDVVGCTAVRMENAATGEPAVFQIGSSAGHSSGLRCEPGGFAALFARTFDGETYSGDITPYVVLGPLVEPGIPIDVDWVGADVVRAEVGGLLCPGATFVVSPDLDPAAAG
jgi:hypothetical protein